MLVPVRNQLLTKAEAAELLLPHVATLREIVQGAWARWQRNPDAGTARKSTRASAIYDYFTEDVERLFGDTPGVQLVWRHGALNMILADEAVVRFKKLRGRSLRTSGVATYQRLRFLAQDEVFDGMVVTNLVIGYRLDELETQIDRIAVTCPQLGGNLWTYDLPGGDTLFDAGAVPITSTDPQSGGTTIRSTKVAESDGQQEATEE